MLPCGGRGSRAIAAWAAVAVGVPGLLPVPAVGLGLADAHVGEDALGPARAALSAVHGVVMELGVNEVGKLAILPDQDIIDRLNDVKRLLSRYPAST